jgi:hypothetical protein
VAVLLGQQPREQVQVRFADLGGGAGGGLGAAQALGAELGVTGLVGALADVSQPGGGDLPGRAADAGRYRGAGAGAGLLGCEQFEVQVRELAPERGLRPPARLVAGQARGL